MHRGTTQIPVPNHLSQPPRRVAELVVVARRQFELLPLGQANQFLCLRPVERKRFLDIDATARVQGTPSDLEVTLGRGRDVHDIRPGRVHQLRHITEVFPDMKALGQLPRHQLFPVADAHEFTSSDPLNLRGVGVRDLPASDDRHPKHAAPAPGNSRSRH